jgi:carbonic anhydrase/acetyltransferase-like protein (isoleucine patch superfamily)
MPIYALGESVPVIDPSAFVHPDAVVIGAVRIGAQSSVWPSAVLRGDTGRITVGARTSVQDGTVVHATNEHDTVVGDDCVVGHIVHLEGCTVEDGALVGNGSIVLHNAVVGAGAVIGSNAVVTNGTRVPPGALALGVPARIREGGADADMIRVAAQSYVERARRFREGLRRLD